MLSRVEQRTNGQPLDAMDRKQKIRWTETEERLIAEALADQITSRPYRRTFTKAIKVVQEQLVQQGKLDENRQRDIQGPTNITSIINLTTLILKSRREDAKQVAWARSTLKQQHHKQTSREDILDQLTDEEVVVHFESELLRGYSMPSVHIFEGRGST
jgi:polyphosphate kinase